MMNRRDHRLLSKAHGVVFIEVQGIGKALKHPIICVDSDNRGLPFFRRGPLTALLGSGQQGVDSLQIGERVDVGEDARIIQR